MSQAKVDRYKEEKKNRKEIIAKEKRQHVFRAALAVIAAAAVLGWAGFSGYQAYQKNKPLETIYTDITAINDYMTGLDAE